MSEEKETRIDVESIKQRLRQVQQKTKKRSNLWRPNPGKQTIRIVPNTEHPENPFSELYFHYDFNGKHMLSPVTYGDPDPINEKAEKLMSTNVKSDYQLAKKLRPTMRTYVPVVVRGEEQRGVRFWGFGIRVYKELMNFITDPEYGDITDPKSGRDIVVKYVGRESTASGYPETNIHAKINKTPVTTNKSLLKQILKDQPKLSDIYKVTSYDELEKELEIYLEGGDSNDEDDNKSLNNSSEDTSDIEDVTNEIDKLMKQKE